MTKHNQKPLAENSSPELAAQALDALHELAGNIAVFKDRCKRLIYQCADLLHVVREDRENTVEAAKSNPVDETYQIINKVSESIRKWSTWHPAMAAVRQFEIGQGLEDLERDLARCAIRLNLMRSALVLQLDWVDAFHRESAFCLDGRITILGKYAVAGGGYSDVWQGSFDSQIVAIKVMRAFAGTGRRFQHRKVFKRLWREYLAWSCLSHPNVLVYLGFSYDFCPESYVCPSLVSPWMSNGDVLSYLEHNPGVDRLELLGGIAEGLSYLHSRRPSIVHGDLRAGNVLVSELGVPCLSDFGLSRVLSEVRGMTTSTEVAGSLRWMSPELLHVDSPGVTVHSDTWAYGMTILEILSGHYPYYNIKYDMAVMRQIQDGVTPPRPEDRRVCEPISDDIWSICQQCWCLEPTLRPYVREVTAKLSARPIHRSPQLYSSTSPSGHPPRNKSIHPLPSTPLYWTVVSQLQQAPRSSCGGLLDIHIAAFATAIELLLIADGSSTPVRVSAPMGAVSEAVASIIDDVRDFENRSQPDRFGLGLKELLALRERIVMTLSNLKAAARIHGKRLSTSPVSDIETSARQLSNAVIEVGKLIHIRKATEAEEVSFAAFANPTSSRSLGATNGFSTPLCPVDEDVAHLIGSSANLGWEQDHGSPTKANQPQDEKGRERARALQTEEKTRWEQREAQERRDAKMARRLTAQNDYRSFHGNRGKAEEDWELSCALAESLELFRVQAKGTSSSTPAPQCGSSGAATSSWNLHARASTGMKTPAEGFETLSKEEWTGKGE